MFTILTQGAGTYFGLSQILFSVLGVFVGLVVGVLPGLGPLLGIILATPLAMYLEPVAGMGLLIGIYVGGSCGGAITAIVLRIPGTPIAAATLLDGYPMAQKGLAQEAVGLAVASSALGGLVGGVALVFFAPALANIALQFGPPEFFALGIMGLVTIAIVAREATIKGLISGALGIGISLVGMDLFTSYERFTFGSLNMTGGFNLVAVLLGVFAVSQFFIQIVEGKYNVKPDVKIFQAPFSALWRVIKAPFTLIRSSLIGAFIGALPGVGAVVGNFVAYSVSKSYSKRGKYYGTGEPEGVITTESANNACCGGALIPSLALAIPGDPITAVLLGSLLLLGFNAGPSLFVEHQDIVGGIFLSYLGSNVILFVIGILCVPLFISVIRLRRNKLLPIIILLSIVGVYSIQNSIFDIWVMWAFGGLGFLMRQSHFPLAPLVIGRVLGPIVESAFRRSLTVSQGDFSIFVRRPITLAILIVNAIILIWTILQGRIGQKRTSSSEEKHIANR